MRASERERVRGREGEREGEREGKRERGREGGRLQTETAGRGGKEQTDESNGATQNKQNTKHKTRLTLSTTPSAESTLAMS